MYSVSSVDLLFAVTLVVIAMLMAFSFGYTVKMERLTTSLANETAWGIAMQDHSIAVEDELCTLQYTVMTSSHDHRNQMVAMLANQQKELKRLHREAMKKYKASCNATLAKQVSLLTLAFCDQDVHKNPAKYTDDLK